MSEDNIFLSLFVGAVLSVVLMMTLANVHYNNLKFECLTTVPENSDEVCQ